MYMMDTEVQAAQLEAMVGNVKTGLSSVMHRHLTVSNAFPPPTPKTMSAFLINGKLAQFFYGFVGAVTAVPFDTDDF